MSASTVLKLMKEKEIEYVDLRFTDPRGKLQHLTMDGKVVNEEMLNVGVYFVLPQNLLLVLFSMEMEIDVFY